MIEDFRDVRFVLLLLLFLCALIGVLGAWERYLIKERIDVLEAKVEKIKKDKDQ